MKTDFTMDMTQMRLIAATSLRWTARAMSILLLIYLFLSFVTDFPGFLHGFETRGGDIDIGMLLMAAGLIGAWFRGGIGAFVIFVGYLLEMIGSRHILVNWVFALIPLAGMMFLAATHLDKGKLNTLRF